MKPGPEYTLSGFFVSNYYHWWTNLLIFGYEHSHQIKEPLRIIPPLHIVFHGKSAI
jgi:hypothetical protein